MYHFKFDMMMYLQHFGFYIRLKHRKHLILSIYHHGMNTSSVFASYHVNNH